MTPNKLAKSGTEHAHQVAFFAYCAIARRYGFEIADKWACVGPGALIEARGKEMPISALEWIHAIPNGGSRGDSNKSRSIRGGILKAEGVKKGVADIFLPHSNVFWHGLYIEMKRPDLKPKTKKGKGGLSKDQLEFEKYCNENKYGFTTCYDWREAVDILIAYMQYGQHMRSFKIINEIINK